MNELVQVTNPISGEVAAQPKAVSAAANTDMQRAIAEVQAAMVVARANPRNQVQASDRILNACMRPGLAEQALYSYARGGTDISGPSIRLAEAIAQNWGNMQFGMRELSQTSGASEVQAFAWDVETNVRREITFTVPHIRHTRSGQYALTDPRDIYENVANNGARRVRACILAVIPGDVVEAAVEQCERTLRSKADTSPEAVQKLVDTFSEEFGVNKAQIETRIQRRVEGIQPAQIVSLRKIYRSLIDAMSVASDWFDPVEGETGEVTDKATKGNAGVKAALERSATKKNAPKTKPEPKPEAAKVDASEQGEGSEAKAEPVSDGQPAKAEWVMQSDELWDRLEAATTLEQVKAIDEDFTKVCAGWPSDPEEALNERLRTKRRELQDGEV